MSLTKVAEAIVRHDLDNHSPPVRDDAWGAGEAHKKTVIRRNVLNAVISGASALPVPVVPIVAGAVNLTLGVVRMLGGGVGWLAKKLLADWVKGDAGEAAKMMKSGVMSALLGAATCAAGVAVMAGGPIASALGTAMLVVNGVASAKNAADAGARAMLPASTPK